MISNVEGCDLAIQFGVKFTETSPGINQSNILLMCRHGPPRGRAVGGDGDADAVEGEGHRAGLPKTFALQKSLSRARCHCQGQRGQEKDCMQEFKHSVVFFFRKE